MTFRVAAGVSVSVAVLVAACGSRFETPTSPPSEGGDATEAGADGGALAGSGGAKPSGGSSNTSAGAVASTPGGAGDTHDAGAAGASAEGGAPSLTSKYRQEILDDSPLAYWRMGAVHDSIVADETGGGNDLVLQGSGHELNAAGAVVGDSDTAIGFDGASSFAIATDPRVLDFPELAPFTLECWARRHEGGASYFQYLLSSVKGVANNRDGYSLYLLPEPAITDSAKAVFEYDRPEADLGVNGALPESEAWAHYAAVFDGTKAALYVNGTLTNSTDVTGTISKRTSTFTVGRASDANGYFFKGEIDEVAVYAKALSVSEIARHLAAAR